MCRGGEAGLIFFCCTHVVDLILATMLLTCCSTCSAEFFNSIVSLSSVFLRLITMTTFPLSSILASFLSHFL